jgi:hypothetical protein
MFKASAGINKYVKCLSNNHVLSKENNTCRKFIASICPKRFRTDPMKENYCHKSLWHPNLTADNDIPFAKYHKCVNSQRSMMESKCLPDLNRLCQNSQLHVTKTVRVNMQTAGQLLTIYPNMRVIQIIRDPRGVVLSRSKNRSFHGKGTDLVEEAALFCKSVWNDVLQRKKLEEQFPGSTYQLIYDEFVTDPLEIAHKVHSFLNVTVPNSVLTWLSKNTGVKRNSTNIASKWQDKLTFKLVRAVDNVCEGLYNSVKHTWPR